jgi:hypothetical protein
VSPLFTRPPAPVPARAGVGELPDRVRLVGAPQPIGRIGASLLLDLSDARVLPEDVMRAEKTWRRHLSADTIAWEPVDVRTLRAHVYLTHPLTQVTSWLDLTHVDGSLDRAPMGVTAIPGQWATFWWRGSQLVVGGSGAGKTVTLRAMLRGLVVQQVPVRVTLCDNKGDFVDWSTAHGLGGYARGHGDCVDLLDQFVARMDRRYDQRATWPGDTFELVPTYTKPLEVAVVGELLPMLGEGTKDQRQRAGAAIAKVARTGREAAFAVWGAAQTATKEESTALALVRDMFPGRIVLRVPNASMVTPALGVGVDAGAAAHLIPEALTGVGYYRDPNSTWPVMFRSAYSRRVDQMHLSAQLGIAHGAMTDDEEIELLEAVE